MNYTKTEKPETYEDIPITVLVPAYAISELQNGFSDGIYDFYSVSCHRYGCCQYIDGYGDDDASSRYDIAAV